MVSFSDRSRIGNDTSAVSANLSQILEGHFSWQAQYLVSLEGDICCPTHCKCVKRIQHEIHFSWQANIW